MGELSRIPGPSGRSIVRSRRSERRVREYRAAALAVAIAKTHPDDARQILVAALLDLSAGAPPVPFIEATRSDARWWSGRAGPLELVEYVAAGLDRLRDQALHLGHRKRLFSKLWQTFDDDTRRAWLAKIESEGERP